MKKEEASLNMQLQAQVQQNNPLPLGIRFYSLVVALLPVLASYASGVPGFSVADAALALCCVWAVLGGYTRKVNEFTVRPVLIAAALYLILLFNLTTALVQQSPEYGNMAIRTIRYFFYLAVVVLCSGHMLDLALCKKAVRMVALLASGYIFLQFALYTLFGVILRGYLPFLRLYVEGYAATDYASLYAAMYRPTSFFLEPAHFARYAVVGVALLLFDGEKLTARDVLGAVFVSAAVLVSTSAQGYLLLALVWLLCLLLRSKDLASDGLKGLFFLAALMLPLLMMGILRLPFVQTAVARALNIDFSNLANENTAMGARLGGFTYYLELPVLHQIIGMGFGVVPPEGWLSSAPYWLYGSGCIVFGLYLVYSLLCLGKSRGAARIIGLLFLILFFTDDSFYNYLCVLFISLACLKPCEGRESQ